MSGSAASLQARRQYSTGAAIPGPAFPWAVYTDHARVMQAAVAMVAIGTYAAATRSSRSRPGHVCVSVSVSTGRRALSGLGWSQQSAPRRGMRGSERGVLCVEVRFTGQGYSAAELDGDPFDPFGRLRHGDESLRLGSSGLRLAVVRGVASSLEGEAGLASGGEDCGAHLWLRVPVTVVRRGAATRTFADGAQLVAAVEAALDAGEAELEAGGGPPGTSGAETGAVWGLPDGVLVDGSMPVLGGVDAIRAIVALGKARAPWWEPRLWLVTGDVTAEGEAEALRAGADGMLRKPVTGERLVSSLLGAAGCHWTRATVLTVMAVAYGLVAVSIVKSGTMPGWLRSRSNMLVLAQARLTELRLGRNSSAGEAIAVALRSMDRAVHQVDAVMYSSLAVAALLFILTFASSRALTPTLRSRITAFGVVALAFVAIWPPLTASDRQLVPVPFVPGSCSFAPSSMTARMFLSGTAMLVVGMSRPKSDEDALRDRVVSVGTVSVVLGVCTLTFAFIVSVLMLLELHSSVAHVRSEQSRMQSDALVRAMTYVSHHARGPLNAAVLCMAVLEDDAACSMPQRPAHVRGKHPAPSASHGQSVDGYSRADEAPFASEDELDSGSCTPTLSSSSIMRDLQIALESSKQELDDLLLWQRLSAKDSSSLMSWGAIADSWAARLCHWTRATVLTVMAVAYGLVAVSIVKSGTMPGWLRSRSNMLVLAQARLTELRLGRNSSAGEAIAVALRSMDRAVHQVDAVMYSSLAVAALLFILTFASSRALTPTLRGRITAFGVVALAFVAIWPPVTASDRQLVPVPFVPGSCSFAPSSMTARMFLTGIAMLIVGMSRPKSDEDLGLSVLSLCVFVALMVTLVVTGIDTRGCDEWRAVQAAAPAGSTWPDGLDLSGSQALRDRVVSVGTVSVVVGVCTLAFAFIASVSMLLELQSSVAHVRSEQSRMQSDALVRAMTYVSHHARGPLNAAVLCMAVLEDDAACSMPQRPAHVRGKHPAPSASHGQSVDGYSRADEAPFASEDELDSGSCTPTLSSSSIMRDLQIALESSKQELDDLLLWQRLSAKDSSSLMSWGAIADSWAARLCGHFARHRRAAALVLDVWGCHAGARGAALSSEGRQEGTRRSDEGRGRSPAASHRHREGDASAVALRDRAREGMRDSVELGEADEAKGSVPAEPLQLSGQLLTRGPSRGHSPGCGCEDCRGRQPPAWSTSRSNPHRVALPPSNPATPGGSDAAGSSTPQGRLREVPSSWAERPPSGPAAPSPSPSPSCFGVGSAGSGASEATHDAPGAAFPWAVYTDHARVMQAAVAMVAIGTYAAATRSSRSRPGHVCVSVSVSTGRRALSGLGWSQQSAPRRGMRGSERGVLCVEVRFTGQGYSAAELDGDPFDPFGRLRHGDESLRLGSSGLRLAVVRGVASSLEGEAGLASGGEDCGAHLWLRVPVTVVRRSSESWAEHVRRQCAADSAGLGSGSRKAAPAAGTVEPVARAWTAAKSPGGRGARAASGRLGRAAGLAPGAALRLAPARSSRSPTNRANAPLSGWRVWVADDDPTAARVSALVVRRSGAATRTFADGAQLVAAVEAALDAGEAELEAGGGPPGTSGAETGAVWGLPDGVLVDGSMPVLGGVDAIRAIVALGKARAPWWEPRLWLVTGDVTAEGEAEALRAGADGMLRKPVTGERLVSSLLGAAG
ncbi:hypothetical protein FNF28_06935 [Cafeteria roenbergensis]|uniref:histidine kinase n=1 Tax=Cafeteria roenbergensis TaxID=33653 RepID=A0A5A8CN07_CAFRO|nr:hypothetical protein FNF28_06935 [Cafeteria roenbergensis]